MLAGDRAKIAEHFDVEIGPRMGHGLYYMVVFRRLFEPRSRNQ